MATFLSGVATLFYRLVDHSIEISVLICLIFLIKWVAAKKLPSWWHYSLWLMLLIRMLVPIEFENRLNVYNFVPDIRENQVFGMITDASFENETSAAEFTPKTSPNRPNWQYFLKNAVPMLWLVGAMVFGIFILLKSISFWRSVRRLPPIADNEVLHLLSQCKDRMRINAVIDVIVTDKVRSPALFGYFHSQLLLPKGIFERLSDEDLSYAFMHELGHMKRHDIGVSWIMAVLQAAYWFNPLVWIAFYHMRIDQESACDESVLSRIKRHQSTDYAKAIVGFLEKFYQNCQLPSLAGVMENKTQMKRRIANIVHYKKYSQKLRAAAITLFISTGFILYLFTGVAEVKQTQYMMEPEEKGSLPVNATSVADGKNIIGVEFIPDDFFTSQTEITSKPVHLTLGDVPHSTAKTENIKETPPADHIVSNNDDAFSQIRAEVPDEAASIDRNQPAIEEPKQFSPGPAFFHEAENSTDKSRVVRKTAELSVNTGHRNVKTSPPAVTDTERRPGAEAHEKQLEEKRVSSLVTSAEIKDSGSALSGVFGMKSGEKSIGKRGIETKRDVSMKETGPDDSGRRAFLQAQENNILSGSSRERAVNHSKAVVATAEGEMAPVTGTEVFSGNNASHETVKTDQGKDGDNVGFLVSDVDMPPRMLRAAFPKYPYKAEQSKITGYIKLRFIVTKDGEAIDTTVVESNPKGVFDKSALEAIESYRFKPGMKDGKAVDVQVSLPIKYNLSYN